jgi:hypothetical protein
VLGPEAPLIALGGGCTLLSVTQLRKDVPQQALLVLGAAGSFAAISMIFESPVVAAVLVIEATGLGGATLPIVLLPGLLAAGVGSLTFIGISQWAGLDTSAYSMSPLSLPAFAAPTWADIAWSVLLAVAAGALVFLVSASGSAWPSCRRCDRTPYCRSPAPSSRSSRSCSTRPPITAPSRCCCPARTPCPASSPTRVHGRRELWRG